MSDEMEGVKPKYKVSVDDIQKLGRYTPDKEVFGLMKGEEVKTLDWLSDLTFLFLNDESYLVLKNLELQINSDKERFYISDISPSGKFSNIIFYDCLIPDMIIENFFNNIYIIKSYLKNIIIKKESELNKIYIDKEANIKDIIIESGSKCDSIIIKSGSTVGNFIITNNSEIGSITVTDSSVIGEIAIENSSKAGNIRITSKSSCEEITLINNSTCNDINIEKVSLCKEIRVSDGSKSGDIRIRLKSICKSVKVSKNSEIGDLFTITNGNCGDILITDKSTVKHIFTDNISLNGDLHILNSSVNEIKFISQFFKCVFNNASIVRASFSKCTIVSYRWLAASKGEVYIDESKIIHLELKKTALLKDTIISINNSNISIIELKELIIQGHLILQNIKPLREKPSWSPQIIDIVYSKWPIVEPKSNNAIKMALKNRESNYNVIANNTYSYFNTKPLFRIVDSSLGKTEISGSKLQEFHWEYRNSKIIDCFITGTELPNNKLDKSEDFDGNYINIYEISKQKNPLIWHEQNAAFYNQLKKIFESQGDMLESTWYHASAMKHHEMFLEQKAIKGKSMRFGDAHLELLNFRMNKLSNKHGVSWGRAIAFTLISALLFYIFYFFSLNYDSSFTWYGTNEFISDYFKFLNPTRRVDSYPNGWAGAFDILGRIFIAYGIYQFIAAFRRYGRKVS